MKQSETRDPDQHIGPLRKDTRSKALMVVTLGGDIQMNNVGGGVQENESFWIIKEVEDDLRCWVKSLDTQSTEYKSLIEDYPYRIGVEKHGDVSSILFLSLGIW